MTDNEKEKEFKRSEYVGDLSMRFDNTSFNFGGYDHTNRERYFDSLVNVKKDYCVWNMFDPPRWIDGNYSQYGYRIENRYENVLKKPSLENQFSFLSSREIIDWSKLEKGHIDYHLLNEKIFKQINTFDEIFSPSLILPKVSDRTKEIYKKFRNIEFLDREEVNRMYHSCRDIRDGMKEQKKKVMEEVERILDHQIDQFEKKVMNVYEKRNDILSKFDEKKFEEKVSQQRVKVKTESETPLTKIIMNCNDALRIIFKFLDTKDLLCSVYPSCSYFYHLLRKEVLISVFLQPEDIDLKPMNLVLSGYRIRELGIGNSDYPIIINLSSESKRLEVVDLLLSNRETLTYLELSALLEASKPPSQKKKKKKKLEKSEDEEEEEEVEGEDVEEEEKLKGREYNYDYDRERKLDVEFTRISVYDVIQRLTLLESLSTYLLPTSLQTLENLSELWMNLISPSISSNMDCDRKQIQKCFDDHVETLINYFSTTGRPKMKKLSLHMKRECEKDINALDRVSDVVITKTVKNQLTLLHDTISVSCPNIVYLQIRMLFGFETFSEKFMDYLVSRPSTVLTYKHRNPYQDWGGLDFVEEPTPSYSQWIHKIEYLGKSMGKYRLVPVLDDDDDDDDDDETKDSILPLRYEHKEEYEMKINSRRPIPLKYEELRQFVINYDVSFGISSTRYTLKPSISEKSKEGNFLKHIIRMVPGVSVEMSIKSGRRYDHDESPLLKMMGEISRDGSQDVVLPEACHCQAHGMFWHVDFGVSEGHGVGNEGEKEEEEEETKKNDLLRNQLESFLFCGDKCVNLEYVSFIMRNTEPIRSWCDIASEILSSFTRCTNQNVIRSLEIGISFITKDKVLCKEDLHALHSLMKKKWVPKVKQMILSRPTHFKELFFNVWILQTRYVQKIKGGKGEEYYSESEWKQRQEEFLVSLQKEILEGLKKGIVDGGKELRGSFTFCSFCVHFFDATVSFCHDCVDPTNSDCKIYHEEQ